MSYTARFGDVGGENELCHVFLGRMHEVIPDPAEVQAVRLFSPALLRQMVLEQSGGFAPWVEMCLRQFPLTAFTA
jgi:isopentenyldiphosphate isomerase